MRRARHAACALLVALALPAARAQLGFGLTLASDQRFRGVSLSQGRPGLRADLAWDGTGGVYAGASVASVALEPGMHRAELLGYAGVARRGEPLGWDAGASAAHFADAPGYDYAEGYAGLSGERWSLRAAYSPDYFGQGRRTVYVEANAERPLAGRWRAFGHAGVLATPDAPPVPGSSRRRADVRLGVACGFDAGEVQLAGVGVGRGGAYPLPDAARRHALVLSLSLFF